MQPFVLETTGLRLDQPVAADVEAIVDYCQDPVFERFLTLPWPYRRGDAVHFVEDFVPGGWRRGDELTWALRAEVDGPFLGVIGMRLATTDIGFWLGAPHRGLGLMPAAVRLITGWVFDTGFAGIDAIHWECIAGNAASAAVARKCGFTFTGVGPAVVTARDGSHPESWHAVLRKDDPLDPKAGWPA